MLGRRCGLHVGLPSGSLRSVPRPQAVSFGSRLTELRRFDDGLKTRMWMIAKPLKNNHAGVSEA